MKSQFAFFTCKWYNWKFTFERWLIGYSFRMARYENNIMLFLTYAKIRCFYFKSKKKNKKMNDVAFNNYNNEKFCLKVLANELS